MIEIREWPHKPKDSKRVFLNGQQIGFFNPHPGKPVLLLFELLPHHLREVKQAVALHDAGGDERLALDLYDARIIRQAPKLVKQ